MTIKPLALSFVILALGGCTSTPPYHPAQSSGGIGYSDERLAENRFRVTFTGGSTTRRETVENFLLLRSAEVTKNAGYAWFVFDDRDTTAKTTYQSDFGVYPWGPGFGRYHRSWRYDPWDPYWRSTAFPTTRYEAYAEIVLLTPEQAKQEPHALNADDVIARIGPKAAPPPTN